MPTNFRSIVPCARKSSPQASSAIAIGRARDLHALGDETGQSDAAGLVGLGVEVAAPRVGAQQIVGEGQRPGRLHCTSQKVAIDVHSLAPSPSDDLRLDDRVLAVPLGEPVGEYPRTESSWPDGADRWQTRRWAVWSSGRGATVWNSRIVRFAAIGGYSAPARRSG